MENQIFQAVEIALDPSSPSDLKQQALNYIDQVKTTEDAWKVCFPILTNPQSPDAAKVFIFQIIDSSISNLAPEKLDILKGLLLDYLSNNVVPEEIAAPKSGFLKNKLATTFAYCFYYSYLNIWPSFFKTFIKLIEGESDTKRALVLIDYYLRILLAIHSEIGDKLYQDEKSLDASNNLKDLVRLNDMAGIVVNWKHIINFLTNDDDTAVVPILKLVFKVIGSWISWIDINLLIQDDFFLENFFKFFQVKLLQTDIVELFIEIITKKMASDKKFELLDLLKVNDLINSSLPKLLKSISVSSDNDQDSPDDDLEFAEALAKLLNVVGIEYFIIVEKNDSDISLKEQAFAKLNEVLPVVLQVLPNDYDDISLKVFPFISNFLTVVKKLSRSPNDIFNVAQSYSSFLQDLLLKIVMKMKYDDSDDGLLDEDDDETLQFLENREKLKVFQETVSAAAPDLFVETVTNVINDTLFSKSESQFGARSWRTFELGVYELTNFSEILRSNTMKLPKNEINKSKPFLIFQRSLFDLIDLMGNTKESEHPLIQLSFLELVVKHYSFFLTGTNVKTNYNENNILTNRILEIINSKSGIFNKEPKVQKQCFYLFSRFIKLTKPKLDGSILKTLIESFRELLTIKAQVNPDQKLIYIEDKDREGDDEERVEDSFLDSQSNLFETLGYLIFKAESSEQETSILMDMVLNPLFNDLKQCMDIFPNFQYELDKQQVLLQIHHCLYASGSFAKGFEVGNKVILEKFKTLCDASVVVLNMFRTYKIIRDATRFLFSRLMSLLNGDFKDELQQLVSIVLSNESMSAAELSNLISFVNQMVYALDKDMRIYELFTELISTMFDKIYKVLSLQKTEIENHKDDPIGRALKTRYSEVQKTYLTFLLTLVNNHVLSLIVNEPNQKLLPIVFESVFECIKTADKDAVIGKLALNVLENFIAQLSGGSLNDKQDCIYKLYEIGELKVEGIDEYLLKETVSTCFVLSFGSMIDGKDGKSRMLLFEIGVVFKLLFKSYKQVFISYLQEAYFVEINFPSQLGNDFLQALVNLDDQQFKRYYVEFLERAK